MAEDGDDGFLSVRLPKELLQRIERLVNAGFTGYRSKAGYIQAKLEPQVTADEQHLMAMAELRRAEEARGALEKPWPRARKKPD